MSQKGGLILLLIILTAVVFIGGTVYFVTTHKDNPNQVFQRPEDQNQSPKPSDAAMLSNPASEYCIKVGGSLVGKVRSDGGEYNICDFGDNMGCEEWALYRRNCPTGGIKTTGFDTDAEKYCVYVGGKTLVDPGAKCTLSNGHVCSNDDLYNGKCQ